MNVATSKLVRINESNYRNKELSKQKWGFNVLARKKHRAFYGSSLICTAGRNCPNEPLYQVKWCSYKKTGKQDFAYSMKENFKWACTGCAQKWSNRILNGVLDKKDIQYNLPKLPTYVNPALEHGPFNVPPRVYDSRFC